MQLKQCPNCGSELSNEMVEFNMCYECEYILNKAYTVELDEIGECGYFAEETELHSAMKSIKLTTGNDFFGYKTIDYIDIISVEKIVGVGIKTSLKSIGDIFSSLTGSEQRAISDRIKELKKELKEEFKKEAISIGANAIIGIDFETTLADYGAIMVSMNGTAVKIKKDLPDNN